MKTKAIIVHQPGPADSFSYEEIHIDTPKAGELLIKHEAIGVNYIDTYFRSGLYPWTGEGPIIVGAEASGVVEGIGPQVVDFEIGDRVVYTIPNGAYCQHRILEADRVFKLPEDVDSQLAAAVMLKGLTVHYLLRETYPLQSGQTILFHAAAGGVGLLAGQWAAHLGVTTIGTAGSAEKVALAEQNGYHKVINYQEQNFVEQVMDLTDGKGVDVVYDSIGQSTYPHSLKCLKKRGMWVCFGQSSGPISDSQLGDLAKHGSLFTTRPTLFDYIPNKEALNRSSTELFRMVREGHLKAAVHQKYPLQQATRVHQLLEARQTKGATLLIP